MPHSSADELIRDVRDKLEQAFSPSSLEILDESALHAGHAGARGGMRHLALTISSPTFQGMPKVGAHQAIYKALGDLMKTDIHALRIRITG